MAKNQLWHDDYWLLLMQLYLHKPVGVKPMYSRQMVELSIELHIAPQQLFARLLIWRHLALSASGRNTVATPSGLHVQYSCYAT